jgi:hypothetical protein
MDFLAPPQPDFNIEATMKMLKSNPAVITASGWWTVFDKEPTDQSGREDAVFKPLPDIFKKVVDAIIANLSSKLNEHDCSIDFLQNPNMALMSADRHNATRPDGYMALKSRSQGGRFIMGRHSAFVRVQASQRGSIFRRCEYFSGTLRYCAPLPLTLGRAQVHVEHATRHAGRSVSSSHVWHDHRKCYDAGLVLLSLFGYCQ